MSQGFLPFNAEAPTFNRIYFIWMAKAVTDVRTYAQYLLRGRLLKPDSWALHNSIFKFASPDGTYGEVGSNLDYAKTWEIDGIHGPIEPKSGHKVIYIRKRGSRSARSGLKVIERAKTYTKVTYKRPVGFLRAALNHEMTGTIGRKRYEELGLALGFAVLIRYIRLIQKDYGTVSVRIGSAGGAVRLANISNEYGLGLSVQGPSTRSTILSSAMRKAGVLTK